MSVLGKALVVIIGLVILYFAAIILYNAIASANGKPTTTLLGTPTVPDQAPLPLDGKVVTKIPALNKADILPFADGIKFKVNGRGPKML
jgi:hypothetical protein